MSAQQPPVLFVYPQRAAFGRVVPKTRIHAHGKPGARVRKALTAQVAKITWAYKLAPDTINLEARPTVPEIQVFSIELKPGIETLSHDVLRCIDRAINFPIVFECRKHSQAQTIATYKRPSEADKNKWVTGEEYFTSGWHAADVPRQPLPVALDMATLYQHLLRALIPAPALNGETLQAQTERLGRIRALQYQSTQLQGRIKRTIQFNRKVELNSELQKIKTELERISHSSQTQDPHPA